MVLTCVVSVADIATFSVAGRLTSQVEPLHIILVNTKGGRLAD